MQEELVAYNKAHGILTEAYSPLGTGSIFEVKELQEIAQKYNRTVAQVVLRWSIQHGFLPLPKSVTTSRIIENHQVFDFELDQETMTFIDSLKGTAKVALDPDSVDF
ncbi:aldo/keto reductase [Erysipelothrix sp. P66]